MQTIKSSWRGIRKSNTWVSKPWLQTFGPLYMVCLFMLGLSGGAFSAAAAAAAEAPDPVALNWATRAAIARGVAYLKERSAADPDGWIVSPYRSTVPIGKTNVTVRYSKKRGPLYEYETYTAYQRRPGASSQSMTLVPVQLQRVKRIIDPQGGPERLEEDPNGPITMTVERSIRGPGGPDQWVHGRIGHNAMALYALRACGVGNDDATVRAVSGKLTEFVQFYGLPDATWDLAWLAAAYSRLPGREAEELTRQFASKLLDGQILDAPARGLWGPCCIHLPLLAALMAQERDLAFGQGKGRDAAKKKAMAPQSEKAEARAAGKAAEVLNRAQEEAKRLHEDIQRVSVMASGFDAIDSSMVGLGNDNTAPQIRMSGLPDYVFNQVSADLESTALVLFALREVSGAGRMPEKTWRPEIAKPSAGKMARSLPPAETAEAVVARAVHALMQLQGPDGGWTEANIHQPVKLFDGFREMLAGIPVNVGSFKPLPSPQTVSSSLYGYSAVLNAARIAGLAKVQARFQPKLAAGLARAVESARVLPDVRPETQAGGQIPPFDAGFYAGEACVQPGTAFQDRRDLAMRLTLDTVGRLRKEGHWMTANDRRVRIYSSASRARFAALDRRDPKNPRKMMDRGVAYIRLNWYDQIPTADTPALATCYALVSLAGNARPPVAVCRWGDGVPLPLTMAPALKWMEERSGSTWYGTELKWPLTSPDLEIAPLLFASGKGAFTADEATRRSLEGFFKRGGLAILQASATPDGQAFLASAGAVFATCGEGGAVSDVVSSERVLGALAGKLNRPLKGALRKDGSALAVLIPLAEPGVPANDAFRPDEAVKLTVAVIERNMDAALLAPDYAWNLGDLGDATNVYASAMATLSGTEKKAKAPGLLPLP